MYGQSSPLLYFNGHNTCIIESQEGVQQGDPLGPALFSLAIHPIICKAQEKSTTTTVLAYLDDIFVVAIYSLVPQAVSFLKALSSQSKE